MAIAGILLTGGASRRMGRDKAAIRVGGRTLAARTAALLARVADPAVEVGPRHTDLATALEPQPGRGPLAAIGAGWEALTAAGWRGPALVVATDLPALTDGLLQWLANAPGVGTLIPVSDGRPQPLCARYAAADLERVAGLVEAGHRALGDLLARIDPEYAGPEVWVAAAGRPDALQDVDTPEDLACIVPAP